MLNGAGLDRLVVIFILYREDRRSDKRFLGTLSMAVLVHSMTEKNRLTMCQTLFLDRLASLSEVSAVYYRYKFASIILY